jgi:hypothetical protein
VEHGVGGCGGAVDGAEAGGVGGGVADGVEECGGDGEVVVGEEVGAGSGLGLVEAVAEDVVGFEGFGQLGGAGSGAGDVAGVGIPGVVGLVATSPGSGR